MRDMMIEITCPMCGTTHFVTVNKADYEAWQAGKMAQDAFPYLTADEREQLISRLCPFCIEDFFGSDEDEEEEDVDACMRESLEFTGQWW